MIDTFAWIEYFAGSKRGEKAKQFIEGGDAITPAIVIAEFTDKYLRESIDPTERLKFIRAKTMVVSLDDGIGEAAGAISAERRRKIKRWGLVDSCILSTARAKGARVVTGNKHFIDLTDCIRI